MSKRKNNETKPAERKIRLDDFGRMILDTAIDGYCMLDLNVNILEVNTSLCKMLGYSRDELLTMNLAQIEVSETPQEITKHVDMVIKAGYDRFETKHCCKDGTIIDVEVSAQFCEREKDKIIFSFFRDITEHNKADKALKDSERKYKILFENATGGIIVVETGTRKILYSNPYACKMLDYSEEEMKRICVEQIHDPQDWEYVLSEFESQKRGQKKVSLDIPYLRKDGVKVYADLNFAKVDIDDKECWVAFITDITDRKIAEKALKDSESRYKTLFENAVEGILVAELETRKFTYANPAACKMLGCTEEELKGMYVNEIHPPEDWEYVLSEFNEQARGEKSLSVYMPCLRKDGTVIYADVNAAGGIIDGKKCMIGFFTDVTSRKMAEEALKDSESRYKTLFENAVEGILVAEIETRKFIYANPAACKMLGYTEDELKRMYVNQIHPPDDWEQVLSEFNAQARGEKSLSVYMPCLRKDGTIVYADISAASGMINGKQCNIGFFTDVTEYKRIKTELEKYKEKVLRVQKHAYISSVGSIVAHQINQPLTKISILVDRAAEQMEKESCCPAALENTKDAVAEVQKIASIIRKFRQYSKDFSFETGDKFDINDVAQRIVSMLSEKAKKARMHIYAGGLKELPVIEINEAALEQIFLIIIQNAIEAADGLKPHRLDIAGKFDDGKLEFLFLDDCSGIPPENIEKIFEPFFTTKAEGGGMGLGLDIVQQILIGCGGRIKVESELGKGSTFYVTLPIGDTGK